MANSVKLEVITPSKLFYNGEVNIVIAETLSGDEGFMAGHTWATKLLRIGELWLQEAGSKDYKVAAVAGGFIDVKDSIVIYTDAAEWQEDIDMKKALSEKSTAEDWLAQDKKHDPVEVERAKIAIDKSIIRMHVAEGGRRRKK